MRLYRSKFLMSAEKKCAKRMRRATRIVSDISENRILELDENPAFIV